MRNTVMCCMRQFCEYFLSLPTPEAIHNKNFAASTSKYTDDDPNQKINVEKAVNTMMCGLLKNGFTDGQLLSKEKSLALAAKNLAPNPDDYVDRQRLKTMSRMEGLMPSFAQPPAQQHPTYLADMRDPGYQNAVRAL